MVAMTTFPPAKSVAAAYGANAFGLASVGGATNGKTSAAAPVSKGQAEFEEMVQRSASAFMDTMRKADTVSQQGVVGRASTQQVVEAITQAEIALQAAISIRDKVVQAYQEVLRMPI